jgi:F-type H+-transporting ATPase subunit delta
MSLNLKIVKNYSQALYSSAKKSKVENKALEQITVLGQVFLNSSRIMQALCSPIVDSQIKKKILDLVTSKLKFEKTTANFLYILVKNSRFSLIHEIIENFSEIILDSKNIKHARISSAYNLGKKELNLISGFLESGLGKKIDLETNIDSSLIGGAVIEYDCNLIDCSVNGALDRIKKIAVDSKI